MVCALIRCSHRDTCPRTASTLQMPDPCDEMYKNVKQYRTAISPMF